MRKSIHHRMNGQFLFSNWGLWIRIRFRDRPGRNKKAGRIFPALFLKLKILIKSILKFQHYQQKYLVLF